MNYNLNKESDNAADKLEMNTAQAPERVSGFGKAALIFGLLSLVSCSFGWCASLFGILAFVFGKKGVKKNSPEKQNPARAGIWIGAIVVIFWLPSIIDCIYNINIGPFTRG